MHELISYFACTQISLTDLLCEGKYAELMAANSHTGTDAVTWVWWCVMMGQLVGSLIVGPLADRGDFKTVFWVSVPLTAQVCDACRMVFCARYIVRIGPGWL